ncbi:MAG: hypothetical protein J7M34_06465 [Anaerolineae bacterium]|nr:hypothetical protein [Anaerolineae bacterium]
MSEHRRKVGWMRRFIHWLFGTPFEELPPEFGDPVPPELQVFEAEAEEARHHVVEEVIQGSPPAEQTKPVRQDESLERE